jgi:hypothetical protein
MPIFSAIKDLSLPLDDSFRPATEINYVDAPPYAFHFTTNRDYDSGGQSFVFDDCYEYWKSSNIISHSWTNPNDQSTQKVNLNEPSLHYRRLFVLKYRDKNYAQYYLVPWLVIPYDDISGTLTPVKNKFTLRVRAFSIYEATVAPGVRKRIRAGGATRPLTLKTSNTAITAKWNITPSPSDTIFEDRLKRDKGQEVEIAIPATAQGYHDREHVEITDALGRTRGKLYLLFLNTVPHKVIFFQVTKVVPPVQDPPLASTKLNVSMLPIDPNRTYEKDLNALYLKTGIKHTWVNAVLQYTDGSAVKSMGLPAAPTVPQAVEIDAWMGANFEDANPALHDDVVYALLYNFIDKMVSSTQRNEHLFVFHVPFVGLTRTDVTGVSYPSGRTSCIFTYSIHTLCHEAGHALGLPHYFLANADSRPAQSTELSKRATTVQTEASARFNDLNIHSIRDFYQFHDTMNEGNSSVEFSQRALQTNAAHTSDWSHTAFIKFYVNYFSSYQTDNLLDYSGDRPRTLDRLTKYQIERLRYAINNHIYRDLDKL